MYVLGVGVSTMARSGAFDGEVRRRLGAATEDARLGSHRHDVLQDASDEKGRDTMGWEASRERSQDF